MKLRGVDLNQLVLLHALLEESSVTRASERCGLSTPAMSHALARLRDHFQDPILVRAGRGMVLSELGETLQEPVATMIESLEGLLFPEENWNLQTLRRDFVFHATDHCLLLLGDGLERRVKEEAPGVNWQCLPNRPDDPQRLRDGTLDLAVGVYSELPPEVRRQRLFTDRFVCVVRKGHPLVEGQLSLEKYLQLQHLQVAPRGKPGGLVDRLLAKEGVERRISRAVPYFLSALHLVASTDLLLTISERAARKLQSTWELQIFAPPVELPCYDLTQIWHPRSDSDPAHRWFRGLIKQVASELQTLKS